MAEVNEAEEKKKQQQRDIDKENDRKRFEDMGAGNEQFARENGIPNASTYDASGLVLNIQITAEIVVSSSLMLKLRTPVILLSV